MEPEKTFPFHLEAEQSVLGSVILDNECLTDVIEIITDEDFYEPRNKEIYKAATELFNAGKPVDFVTLTEQLSAAGVLDTVIALDYVVEIVNCVPTSANARYYANIVADYSIRRKVITASEEISSLAYSGEQNANILLDIASQKFFDIAKLRESSFIPLYDLLKENYAKLNKLSQDKGAFQGIPTGFSALDDLLTGLKKGALTLIAARPSMGKSAFALNIATNTALQSKASVAIFTLEMSRGEVGNRILSSMSRIDGGKFKTGDISPNQWGELLNAMARLSEAKIYIDESSSPNVAEIRAKCRKLQAECGLDIVIIDHILLMQSLRRTDNRQQEIAEISRALKILAKDLDVAVIAVSQLNRATESRGDKRPILSDLRDSGAIEQDADVVMLLYREDYYNTDDPEIIGVAECNVAKNRNGGTGKVKLAWLKDITTFETMDFSEDEPF